MTDFVHALASGSIDLKILVLSRFKSTEVLIEGITKLKSLKTLTLCNAVDFKATQLIEISMHLKELLEVNLFIDFEMTEDNFLSFIQNAEKLQKFELKPWRKVYKIHLKLDVVTFEKLVRIVHSQQTP